MSMLLGFGLLGRTGRPVLAGANSLDSNIMKRDDAVVEYPTGRRKEILRARKKTEMGLVVDATAW
jgi:hypothetical protein